MAYVNRRKWLFVLVLCAAVTYASVTLFPGVSEAQSKKPVKIGLLSPFSPPGDAAAGKRLKWGAELAIKYINEEMGGVLGGRPVELVVEDDAGTPADGVAGYRKLVQKDGVVAVVGQYHSSVCLAVTKVSADLGVPVFSTAASSEKITETQLPTIFSIVSLIPDRAKFYVDFAKNMGWNRIAVFGEDTDYGTGFVEWIKKRGTEAGLEVKTTVFPRTTADLTPALLETKAWKPSLLVNISAGAPAYLMVKQAYDIDLFPKVLMLTSYAWPVLPEFWDAVGDKGKYILFTAYFKPGMRVSRLGEWMMPRYKELHNEEPDQYWLNVFGQVLIVAQALNLAKSDDPKNLIKALTSGVFQDWSGDIKFEEPQGLKWHNVSPPIMICQETEVRQTLGQSKLIWPREFGGDGKVIKP